ncbi:MAG: hypothetical protein PHW04_06560 [Candidatus Wallbacteria bacterium]|nr:hypothetical protein [Candidatus Wallbacteria bacterium]
MKNSCLRIPLPVAATLYATILSWSVLFFGELAFTDFIQSSDFYWFVILSLMINPMIGFYAGREMEKKLLSGIDNCVGIGTLAGAGIGFFTGTAVFPALLTGISSGRMDDVMFAIILGTGPGIIAGLIIGAVSGKLIRYSYAERIASSEIYGQAGGKHFSGCELSAANLSARYSTMPLILAAALQLAFSFIVFKNIDSSGEFSLSKQLVFSLKYLIPFAVIIFETNRVMIPGLNSSSLKKLMLYWCIFIGFSYSSGTLFSNIIYFLIFFAGRSFFCYLILYCGLFSQPDLSDAGIYRSLIIRGITFNLVLSLASYIPMGISLHYYLVQYPAQNVFNLVSDIVFGSLTGIATGMYLLPKIRPDRLEQAHPIEETK